MNGINFMRHYGVCVELLHNIIWRVCMCLPFMLIYDFWWNSWIIFTDDTLWWMRWGICVFCKFLAEVSNGINWREGTVHGCGSTFPFFFASVVSTFYLYIFLSISRGSRRACKHVVLTLLVSLELMWKAYARYVNNVINISSELFYLLFIN